MKKVLLVFDGSAFSEGAFAFAKWLDQQEKILLTGAFLPQVDIANLWSFSGGAASGSMFIPMVEESDAAVVAENMTKFASVCESNGIGYEIHKDFNGLAMQELIAESRFADLLILGSEKFYESSADSIDYLEDALHSVECPVLVVPEQFNEPHNIVFAYDGEKESVFAAKQFCYLFPSLSKLSTMIVYADKEDSNQLPSGKNIKEWATSHFSDLTITKLNERGKKAFNDWYLNRQNTILIAGAFGRSAVSRTFRKSFTADVLRLRRSPVFIAHH